MDDAALFDLAQGTALKGLDRVAGFLAIISVQEDPDDLLSKRLAPHVFDCAEQLEIAIGFALRCTLPVIDRDWDWANDGQTLTDLTEKCAIARADIAALTAADFAGAATRQIQHRAGDAELMQSARDYVVDFAIPNMWFHLTMAYAALRMAGVEIGKADFDGLHAYRRGFHFV